MMGMSGSKNGVISSMLRRLLWGMGAAALTYVVAPQMRKMARPVVSRGVDGVKGLAQRGRDTLGEYKFRYKSEKGIPEMSQDSSLEHLHNQKDQLTGIVQQLQDRVAMLQKEIESFRER